MAEQKQNEPVIVSTGMMVTMSMEQYEAYRKIEETKERYGKQILELNGQYKQLEEKSKDNKELTSLKSEYKKLEDNLKEKVTSLEDDKTNLLNALEAKGVSVDDNEGIYTITLPKAPSTGILGKAKSAPKKSAKKDK